LGSSATSLGGGAVQPIHRGPLLHPLEGQTAGRRVGTIEPDPDPVARHDLARHGPRDDWQVAELDAGALLAQVGHHGIE